MEIETLEISSSPTTAKIMGFVLGYGIRFVQTPFYFSVFFLAIYISGTLFHSHFIEDKLIAALLWPLVLFRYPDNATYYTLAPVITIVAFWLFVFHTFWFVLGKIFQRSWLFQPQNNRYIVNYAFLITFGLAAVSTLFATNVKDKFLMLFFLFAVSLVGWGAFWASKAFFAFSDALIKQDPATTKYVK